MTLTLQLSLETYTCGRNAAQLGSFSPRKRSNSSKHKAAVSTITSARGTNDEKASFTSMQERDPWKAHPMEEVMSKGKVMVDAETTGGM